jgi:hypothetical protein
MPPPEMGNDDRGGVAAVGHPTRRIVIVGDALPRELQGAAFGSAGIADAQDVVAAPVEREAREAQFGERWRQPARRANVEVHRVAVEIRTPPRAGWSSGQWKAPSSGKVSVAIETSSVRMEQSVPPAARSFQRRPG